MNELPKNYVKVSLKKSSSSGGTLGYDIDVQSDGSITQKDLDLIAEMALKTALKVRNQL